MGVGKIVTDGVLFVTTGLGVNHFAKLRVSSECGCAGVFYLLLTILLPIDYFICYC